MKTLLLLITGVWALAPSVNPPGLPVSQVPQFVFIGSDVYLTRRVTTTLEKLMCPNNSHRARGKNSNSARLGGGGERARFLARGDD